MMDSLPFFFKSCLQGFVSRQISSWFDPSFRELFSKHFFGQIWGYPTQKFLKKKLVRKNFSLQDFGSRQFRSFPVLLTPLLMTLFLKSVFWMGFLGAPRDPRRACIWGHPFWIFHIHHGDHVRKKSHFGPDLQWSLFISCRAITLYGYSSPFLNGTDAFLHLYMVSFPSSPLFPLLDISLPFLSFDVIFLLIAILFQKVCQMIILQ